MAQEREAAPLAEPSFFTDTLSVGEEGVRLRHILSAPIGVAAHGAALAAVVLGSMFSGHDPLVPSLPPTTILQFAPPPPPATRLGAAEPHLAAVPETRASVSTVAFVIPEETIAPALDLDASVGMPDGFTDGDIGGTFAGLPGGVVGGVPDGRVGGVIGGTGDDLPAFLPPDVGPKPIRMPPASYTEEAIRREVRGSVRLRAIIDEQGRVRVLEILRSIPELDEQAVRTVESSWRFEPALKNGRPIPCLSDLVVRFNLH